MEEKLLSSIDIDHTTLQLFGFKTETLCFIE